MACQGADPTIKGAHGGSPLGWAVYNNRLSTALVLASHPAVIAAHSDPEYCVNVAGQVGLSVFFFKRGGGGR